VRETRYGYGRERRLRLVISWERPGGELTARVARREDCQLLGQEFLLGEDD